MAMILLASFPKSGNTWLRMVLSNLLYADEAPVSINDIRVGSFKGDRREQFDQISPWSAGDLSQAQIDCLLPEYYRELVTRQPAPVYLKTHDMMRRNADGEWIFPGDCVQAAIHIVRHPLDVLPSYAKHFGLDQARALERLLTPSQIVKHPTRDKRLVPEQQGCWADHTRSWRDPNLPFPVHFARYEDLRHDPQAEFGRLLRAIGMEFSEEALATALTHSRLEVLQQQEQTLGFRERFDTSSAPFFGSGKVGGGKTEVAQPLAQRLLGELRPLLDELGYA
ncbi:sulfotransferase domain-containing protein [Pseudaeromonas sp. ZJS20]|uniref:sulfotransferase domain-containing protein n=1 Tax=Pseudaeromonas aegiceratis TaxID=3153928 RepID=UPI00390CCBD7